METVTLAAPTTKGGIKKLLNELRGQILQPSRTQISHDLHLQSKDELDVWSETELSRLGSVFLSATSEILKRILVDETGIWLIAQMTSPDSRAQKDEDAGRNIIHPILATTWCEILRNGMQPYRQIVNADPSNNGHSSRTVTSNTDLPVMSPFEHPLTKLTRGARRC